MPANALNPEDQAFLVALDEQLQAASSDLRQHERHNERFAIRVIPADPSRAREEPARGRTLDISLGGFRAEVYVETEAGHALAGALAARSAEDLADALLSAAADGLSSPLPSPGAALLRLAGG